MTKTGAVGKEIAIQSWLRPAQTVVKANKDFEQFRDQLGQIDELLGKAHLETLAMDSAVEGFEKASARQLRGRKQFAMKALRFQVLRSILGNPSYRSFSRSVASSELLASFCGVRQIDAIRGAAKSTLDRAAKFFSEKQVRWMHQVLIEMSAEGDRAKEIGLTEPIQTGEVLIDSTCMEANIHYPIDWVLLRDVSRTLLKATILIRRAGLCQRMPEEPEAFARAMNCLCLEMTNTRRKTDANKARKSVLRRIKPLVRTIAGHAKRHRDRLESSWQSTRYSEAQARQIIARIDGMLAQVPAVITQAHERIIGERQVHSSGKILSVYDANINVIVRGKAGKEVEFGNTLMMAESTQGMILDWKMYPQAAPAEWRQLQESVERQNEYDVSEAICAISGDRGFNSKKGSRELANLDIFDATCPRDPRALKERFSEERFERLQRRRASTEARIAIFKQRVARRLRDKGFDHRCKAVAWGVVGHNLWIVARLILSQESVLKAA